MPASHPALSPVRALQAGFQAARGLARRCYIIQTFAFGEGNPLYLAQPANSWPGIAMGMVRDIAKDLPVTQGHICPVLDSIRQVASQGEVAGGHGLSTHHALLEWAKALAVNKDAEWGELRDFVRRFEAFDLARLETTLAREWSDAEDAARSDCESENMSEPSRASLPTDLDSAISAVDQALVIAIGLLRLAREAASPEGNLRLSNQWLRLHAALGQGGTAITLRSATGEELPKTVKDVTLELIRARNGQPFNGEGVEEASALAAVAEIANRIRNAWLVPVEGKPFTIRLKRLSEAQSDETIDKARLQLRTIPEPDRDKLLRAMIEEAREANRRRALATPDSPREPEWSEADSPSKWAKRFGVSLRTFIRRVEDKTIRVKKLSDRLYQVAIPDLPATKSK